MQLVLASGSPYRRALLKRLGLPFDCINPEVDETPLINEEPASLAERLAREKAAAVAHQSPQALVIGSDQVASVDGHILGKPGTHARAVDQLSRCSGRPVLFHTGLCLRRGDEVRACVEPFSVVFRELSQSQIEYYLTRETPYDCAGSFKWEGLGIALFTRLAGDDPTALEGLPLIRLSEFLRLFGLDPLSP